MAKIKCLIYICKELQLHAYKQETFIVNFTYIYRINIPGAQIDRNKTSILFALMYLQYFIYSWAHKTKMPNSFSLPPLCNAERRFGLSCYEACKSKYIKNTESSFKLLIYPYQNSGCVAIFDKGSFRTDTEIIEGTLSCLSYQELNATRSKVWMCWQVYIHI